MQPFVFNGLYSVMVQSGSRLAGGVAMPTKQRKYHVLPTSWQSSTEGIFDGSDTVIQTISGQLANSQLRHSQIPTYFLCGLG